MGTIILIKMNSQTFTYFVFLELLILSLTEIDNVTNMYRDQSKIILYSNINNEMNIILNIQIYKKIIIIYSVDHLNRFWKQFSRGQLRFFPFIQLRLLLGYK